MACRPSLSLFYRELVDCSQGLLVSSEARDSKSPPHTSCSTAREYVLVMYCTPPLYTTRSFYFLPARNPRLGSRKRCARHLFLSSFLSLHSSHTWSCRPDCCPSRLDSGSLFSGLRTRWPRLVEPVSGTLSRVIHTSKRPPSPSPHRLPLLRGLSGRDVPSKRHPVSKSTPPATAEWPFGETFPRNDTISSIPLTDCMQFASHSSSKCLKTIPNLLDDETTLNCMKIVYSIQGRDCLKNRLLRRDNDRASHKKQLVVKEKRRAS